MLVQIVAQGYQLGELSCPTRYLSDSSSISLLRSIRYGLGVVAVTLQYRLSRLGIGFQSRFPSSKEQ